MISKLFDQYRNALYQRSLLVAGFLNRRMSLIVTAWVSVALLAATLRYAVMDTPVYSLMDAMPVLVGYGAVILAPLAGYALARSAFVADRARQPLDFHLSFLGKWRTVDRAEASRDHLYGPAGFMASLLIGLMLMKALGLGINTMTLGGLVVAIGSVVDDSIVDMENCYRGLRRNQASGTPRSPLKVVFDTSVEVRRPVLFSTVIIA